MMAVSYPTKKALKKSIGQPLRYQETSLFGPEYQKTGQFTAVGPSPYQKNYFAQITMEDGLIKKVS